MAKIRDLGETHHDIKGARWLNYRAYPSELHLVSRHFERLGWYDLTARPAGNPAADERPYEPDGLGVLMRRPTLFLVASIVALFILLTAIAIMTG